MTFWVPSGYYLGRKGRSESFAMRATSGGGDLLATKFGEKNRVKDIGLWYRDGVKHECGDRARTIDFLEELYGKRLKRINVIRLWEVSET